jgi:hypothetical protein
MRITLIAAAAVAVAAAVPAFAQDLGNGSMSATKFPTTGQQQHGTSGTPTVTLPSNHAGAATQGSNGNNVGTQTGQAGSNMDQTTGQAPASTESNGSGG